MIVWLEPDIFRLKITPLRSELIKVLRAGKLVTEVYIYSGVKINAMTATRCL